MKYKHLNIFLIVCTSLTASFYLSGQANGIYLKPRVYLQGALHGLLPSATLMRDDLRAQGLLPMTEPYTALNYQHWSGGGGEAITDSAILLATGSNAIVDWVVVELRSITILDSIMATRSALLQRDGDVVDVDGVSPVHFSTMEPDFYHVVVRHRNHLGAMTESPLSLGATPTEINFADPDFPVNCTHGVVTIGSKRALWGGDINRDGRLIFQGPGNDVLKIFTTVLYDPENTGHTAYFVSKGYAQGDANMDGKTIYQGPGNDKAMVMLFLLIHLQLVDLDFYSQYVVIECVP